MLDNPGESEVRIQNGAAVGSEEAAHLFQQISKPVCIAIRKVLRKDEIVTRFLK